MILFVYFDTLRFFVPLVLGTCNLFLEKAGVMSFDSVLQTNSVNLDVDEKRSAFKVNSTELLTSPTPPSSSSSSTACKSKQLLS